MRRKVIAAAGVATLATIGFVATPVRADVTVCHDVSIQVAGQGVADAGCNTIPTSPPELPAPPAP